MALRVLLCLVVFVAVKAQIRSDRRSTAVDLYTALAQVNIRCRNDPVTGLTCAAEYPHQCKEQWNFPNPCTQTNLDMNITKFAHPFDKTKFLMCGQLGKLYVVQCPQYEVFHEGCGQCVGEEAGLTASCEIPLPPVHNNPCTREAILANKLFFPFHGNLSKFIHCDIWGKPWERICTPGEVWSQWDVTCVLPHLLNPCNRPTTDINYLYNHPCEPAKYLTCDAQGRAHEIHCAKGEAFHETNQRCQSFRDFPNRLLSSFCENYIFGFRKFHGNQGILIDPSRTAQTTDLGMMTHDGIRIAGTGAISGITGGGRLRDSRGFAVNRATKKVDGSITVDRTGQGLNANVDLRGGVLNRQTDLQGQGDGTIGFDRSTQVRGGSVTGQITSDGRGSIGGSLDFKRGSLSGSKSGAVDVIQPIDRVTGTVNQGFNQGAASNFIDIRDTSLTNSPTTAEFVDIRNLGTSGANSNMVDVRGVKASGTSNMVDIRGNTNDIGMVDIRDPLNLGTSGTSADMIDIRGVKASGTTNMVDIRDSLSGQGLNANVNLRGSEIKRQTELHGKGGGTIGFDKSTQVRGGTATGQINTDGQGIVGGSLDVTTGSLSGSKSGTIDIIQPLDPVTGTVEQGFNQAAATNFVDIRDTSLTNNPGTAEFVDIRNLGTSGTSANMVDIRGVKASGTSNMVDIHGSTNEVGMVDIRDPKTTGSGAMVDIRGQKSGNGGGVMVDIRGEKMTGTNNRVDVRTDSIGAGFGVSGSQTDTSGAMVDIRGQNTVPIVNGMVDIRNEAGIVDTGMSGSSMIDIISPTIDPAGGIFDIGGLDPGAGSSGFVDIGGRTGNMVDKTNVASEGVATGGRMVDIRGSQIDATGSVVDITGQSTGTGSSGGMVDIRDTSGGAGFVDILDGTAGTGSGSQIDASGGFVDISGQGSGSSGGGKVDIRGGQVSGKKTTIDIRGGAMEGGSVDITGSQTGLSGGDVQLTGQGSGTGGVNVNMIDIRGGKGSGTSNEVNIHGGSSGMVDIRRSKTERAGGVIDVTGGSGAGMVDIRRGSALNTMVDVRGTGQGILDSTGTGSLNAGSAADKATWVDIRNQPSSGPTSGVQWVDVRNQGQGSISSGRRNGLGGVTTLDLREQLGLGGQGGITNTQNIDTMGTVRTDTITIEGTMQGDGQGGRTMQELLNTWNTIIGGRGSSNGRGTSQGTGTVSGGVIETGINQRGNGKIIDSRMRVHPSRLKMYDYSNIPFSEPCTQENIDGGRTHFRFNHHPHMFLQCDTSGRMHRMPCSSTGRDWFDVYTNTCVDGPVHVDNRIQ